MNCDLFDARVCALAKPAVLACIAAMLSLLLTRLMLWLLPKFGMMDKPDFKRHIHTRVVPRGGGLGMLLAFVFVACAYFGIQGQDAGGASSEMLRLMLPLAILLPLGLVDDRIGLKARTKFLFQALAALAAWGLGFRMNVCLGIVFPAWLGCILTVFWIVAFINAFNMIDGVDGLASGIGFISAVCMAVTALAHGHSGLAAMLAIFGGTMLGFLCYNWYPARLFMGDTGSMFIGYVLAAAGLCINSYTVSVASVGIPLLACGLPVLDICLAVWRRIVCAPSSTGDTGPGEEQTTCRESVHGRLAATADRIGALAERLGTADQTHIHHRILRRFKNNQRKTVYSIYALAIAMGLVGIICSFLPNSNQPLALAVILGTFAFIINRVAFIELWNTTEILYQGFHSARTGLVFSYVINPLWDLTCILGAYFIAARGFSLGTFAMLRYAVVIMLVLCCTRPYRVFWNFAASDDYFRLACALLFGFLLARASDLVFNAPHIDRIHSYAAGMAITFILMERLFLHYFRNAQIRRHAVPAAGKKPILTVLVGVSPMARLYRNLLASDLERASCEKIVGLVAIDRRFVHSYCFGMRVLGPLEDLEYIVKRCHVGKVVVTREMDEQSFRQLQSQCSRGGIPLTKFDCWETPLDDGARHCGDRPSSC